MALLSNGASMQLSPPGGAQNRGAVNNNEVTGSPPNHFFFSSILHALPVWDGVNSSVAVQQGVQQMNSHDNLNDGLVFSNILGPIGTSTAHHQRPSHHHSHSHSHTHHHHHHQQHSHNLNNDLIGGTSLSPCTSPLTSSSGSSQCVSALGILCGRCDIQAGNRCLDCNDVLCEDCRHHHERNNFTKDHHIIPLNTISPIGSTASANTGSPNNHDPQCDIHGEVLRYICETCKRIVCQECTLWDHKDHNCIPVTRAIEGGKEKLFAVIESGKIGTKLIKTSIDRAVVYSQAVERDAADVSNRIRKAMRHFIMAAEERERTLLERVDKIRQQKLTSLSDQMAGLRAALAGLAQTSDILIKTLENISTISCMDLAQTLTRGESQVEQFAAMYKNLQPKEEFISFVSPNFEILQDIRIQGDVLLINQRFSNGGPPGLPGPIVAPIVTPSVNARRPIVRANNGPGQTRGVSPSWDSLVNPRNISPPINNPNGNIGQAIPGSQVHVVAKPALGPSTTFGFDGSEDGQVSRPWGLCVDKDSNIIVADRRNNRVQIFFPDGSFKLKFGTKGSGNGQFDLPAGISTDPQNRIVVVDKDNHRIQIFTSTGIFVLKFGSYGKDCGQFQYPWDVAVSANGEMLVTDSRNHRIQLFNPDGHFISRFSFDGVNHNRTLKGLTTPRGVCFTPKGHIIVSDFENHRLLLVDSNLSKVLSIKGHEGSGVQEFCRPSGICCDDDGRVIVADSKNQRVLVFSPKLEFLWAVEIRPSYNLCMPIPIDEKDRPSDVALLPDGRLVVMVETSPDARDICNPQKTFIQVF